MSDDDINNDPIVREIPVIFNNQNQTNLTLIDIESKDVSNVLDDRRLRTRFRYEPHDQKLEMFWSKDTSQRNFSSQKYCQYESDIKNVLKTRTEIKTDLTAEQILRETKYEGKHFNNSTYSLLTGKFNDDQLVLFPVRKKFLMKSTNNYANQLSAKLRNAKTSKSKTMDGSSSDSNAAEKGTLEEITIRFSMSGINAKKAAARQKYCSFVPVEWHDFDSNMALATFKKLNGTIEKHATNPPVVPPHQTVLAIEQKCPTQALHD